MVIVMGNDHSAVDLKHEIKAHLEAKGYEVRDFGTDSKESCDYAYYGEKVGRAVAAGEVAALRKRQARQPRCKPR